MSIDINLLSSKDSELVKRQKRVKLFNIIAVTFSLIVVAVSLTIFVMIQITNPLSLKKEQDDVASKISLLRDRQVNLFIINNRVLNIEEVLNKRKDLSKEIGSIFAKIPQRVIVEELKMDRKLIFLTASSASLYSIGELINNLTDMVRKKEIIQSLKLNSLIVDTDKNIYSVSLEAEL